MFKPSLKHGHLEPVAQDGVQVSFEHHQGCKPTTSLGPLCQLLVIPTVKKCFLMLRVRIPCSSLCPLPMLPALGTATDLGRLPGDRAVHYTPSSLHVFTHLDEIFLSLFFSRVESAIALSFSSQKRRSSLFIPSVALCWTPSGSSPILLKTLNPRQP